jgi:hypothetical protein
MPEAESVHSTQPTNTPVSQNNPVDATSRRRFLTNAAGVAAGGAVLAMATVPAAADAAAPVAAVASSGVDPVFALIEGYRTAAKTVALAAGGLPPRRRTDRTGTWSRSFHFRTRDEGRVLRQTAGHGVQARMRRRSYSARPVRQAER